MPKKKDPEVSKKTIQKKKQASIEDKTFGLKNKNKSKKVQQKIASVEKNVMNSGDPKQRKLEEQRAKAKAERKAHLKQMKEEQDALFGAALLAVQKKTTVNAKDGKVEAQGRDGGNDDGGAKKAGTSRAMKMMYQMDAQEMSEKLREDPFYVPTLEDEVEAQRQQKVADLKASGKVGTPVTEESFNLWLEAKRKRRKEAAMKLVEAEFKKKKGGKGLSVLSGRDLYEYKAELFRDIDDDEEDVIDDDDDINDNDNNTDTDTDTNKTPSVSRQASSVSVNDEQNNGSSCNGNLATVDEMAAKVQSDLFLEGDVDDLDDLDDD